MHKIIFSVSVLAGFLTTVISYPADHREDTILPFRPSPGNVNLETYYLDKYPQPGPPSGNGGNIDPIKQPPHEENMMLWDENEGYKVMSRARREANPQHHHHGHGQHHHHHGAYHHHYPSYGHHHHNPYYNYYNNYNPYYHHHHHHGR